MPKTVINPNPPLALATSRELQAHLQQCPEVNVVLSPAQHQRFDYTDSQVAELEITYPGGLPAVTEQLQAILTHYGIEEQLPGAT